MSHPINELMVTAMQNIKEMVDVNTIVGEPVTTPDGMVVIPISKVSFGFASGGGEYDILPYNDQKCSREQGDGQVLPFAGGSGAGISICPVAFMVAGQGQIKLMSLGANTSIERMLDMAPDLISKIGEFTSKKIKKEE